MNTILKGIKVGVSYIFTSTFYIFDVKKKKNEKNTCVTVFVQEVSLYENIKLMLGM